MLTTEWGNVGTRGGCGAGWGPCACPGGNAIHGGLCGATRPHPNEDKHKAPSSPPPRPLSLQDAGGHFLSFPDSVVTSHQDGDLYLTDLDCQHSSSALAEIHRGQYTST